MSTADALAEVSEGRGMDTQVSYPRPEPKPMPRFEVTEDIVISGIAGRFPESDNMDEYADNLFRNVDMVTADDRRWPVGMSITFIKPFSF